MDLARMRELANGFRTQGIDLDECASRIDRLSRDIDWLGRDGDAFRVTWRTTRQCLSAASQALTTVNEVLQTQADQQEQTSNDLGNGPAPTPTNPAPDSPPSPLPAPGTPFPLPPWMPQLPSPEDWAQFESNIEQWAFERVTDVQQLVNSLPPEARNALEWVAGPDSLSIPDITAKIPGLQNAMGMGMDWLETSDLAPLKFGQEQVEKYLGFTYNKEGDFYTTTENSLQSKLGYEDAYDLFHKPLGMDIEHKTMEFDADGKQYRLEFWKGAYGSGASFGGEMGLYVRDPNATGVDAARQAANPDYYPAAGPSDQVRLVQTIYDKHTGQDLMTNDNAGSTDGDHYWNLMLRTEPGYNHDDIGQKGVIYPKSDAVGAAMYNALKNNVDIKDLEMGDNGEISYTWAG